MSMVSSGRWRRRGGGSRFPRALIAAATVLLLPAAPVAQDNQDFVIPGIGVDANALLMADVVEVDVEVAFIAPTGIGEINRMRLDSSYADLAENSQVTVTPANAMGGGKATNALPETNTAASLSVRAAPGQLITIQVDDVVAADGYTLADFRCNYNSGNETPCDGAGYSEISVADGTLMVGATLIAEATGVSAPADGSFAVTISYQ